MDNARKQWSGNHCTSLRPAPITASPAWASAAAALITDHVMPERILAAAGITAPTGEDHRLARLLEQCVYGILTWTTAGRLTADEALADVQCACELLLAPWRSTP
ncbi:hypothetical protein ACFXG4_19590 [Nocardia sp. NPDC059246]|uniref:hypothetical protein n=1 Tax=unclassified Nocardia TaxID=2637762 RepID=UPI003685429A